MHLALHIWKKDLRRLWIGIAFAISLLIALTAATDFVEGEILLLVTWAVLIALAIQEDPLVGDRQFWISRPVPRKVLLVAKALFAVTVVNVPYFLSCIIVLSTRHFAPWHWLPQLLWKQVILTAGFVLPVIAIAAVLQGFAQIALATIAIVGVSIYLTSLALINLEWKRGQDIRLGTFFALIGFAAAVVILLQFSRRRTWQARTLGISGVIAADVALFAMPPLLAARERAAIWPTPQPIAIRYDPRPPFKALGPAWWGNPIEIALPIKFSGVPGGARVQLDLAKLNISAPDFQLQNAVLRRGPGSSPPLTVQPYYFGTDWLMLAIDPQIYTRLAKEKVSIHATAVVFLYRNLTPSSLPVGSQAAIAGGARCSAEVIDMPSYTVIRQSNQLLKMSCESPDSFTVGPNFMFGENRQPTMGIGESLATVNEGFLSPLHRIDSSFPILPYELRTQTNVRITPLQSAGWQVVDFDLRDLDLAPYLVPRTP